MEASMTKLNTLWQSASEEMYKDTQGQPGAAPQGDGGTEDTSTDKGDDEVTDVDFEEVDDK